MDSQTVFDDASQRSLVYVAEMKSIERRLEDRRASKADSVQLAVRAADNDTQKAMEAANFFRKQAAAIQQKHDTVLSALNGLQAENGDLTLKSEKAVLSMNTLAASLFGDARAYRMDAETLISQHNRIKAAVSECVSLSAELGFPSISVPEIVDTLDAAAIQQMANGEILVQGTARSVGSVALQLLLAECQVLKSYNFLLKHTISEVQRDDQGAHRVDSDFAVEQGAEQGAEQGDVPEGVSRQAMGIHPTMSQRELQNPSDVFRMEFNGSGVAVAKALVDLRRRTASLLLRELRFDTDPLLCRAPSDDGTLRMMVAALQNELYHARQTLDRVKNVGLSAAVLPPGDGAEARVFTNEEMMRMSESALSIDVDMDLLPAGLCAQIDATVEDAIEASRSLEVGRGEHSSLRVSVPELQRLIGIRERALHDVDRVAREFVARLEDSGVLLDAGQFALPQAPELSTRDPAGLLAFAQDAHRSEKAMVERLEGESAAFVELIRDVQHSLYEGQRDKLDSDGSNFLDLLTRQAHLLRHVREMHHLVVDRNLAVARQQAVIQDLQERNAASESSCAYLAAIRNGCLKAYVDLSRRVLLLREENANLRSWTGAGKESADMSQNVSHTSTTGADDPQGEGLCAPRRDNVSMACTDVAVSGDPQYAARLADASKCLTDVYRERIAECKREIDRFGDTLADASEGVMVALNGYRLVVETKACKLVQTDRLRKTYDLGTMTAEPEPAQDASAKKKK